MQGAREAHFDPHRTPAGGALQTAQKPTATQPPNADGKPLHKHMPPLRQDFTEGNSSVTKKQFEAATSSAAPAAATKQPSLSTAPVSPPQATATDVRGSATPASASGLDALQGSGEYAPHTTGTRVDDTRNAVRQAASRARSEVVRHAQYTQQNGRSEVKIQLDPPELGRMRLEIAVEDGKLDVRIRVENPVLREGLRSELQHLDRTLKDAQVDVSRLDVSDYQSEPQDERRGAPGGWGGPIPAELSPEESAQLHDEETETWTLITEAGRVDCKVQKEAQE